MGNPVKVSKSKGENKYKENKSRGESVEGKKQKISIPVKRKTS